MQNLIKTQYLFTSTTPFPGTGVVEKCEDNVNFHCTLLFICSIALLYKYSRILLTTFLWFSRFHILLSFEIRLKCSWKRCFADDTLVVTAEDDDDIPMLEEKVNTTLEAIIPWIESARLSLASMAKGVVLFTSLSRFSGSVPLPPKVGDKALYNCKVLGAVVSWKADFQGACKADSSQS